MTGQNQLLKLTNWQKCKTSLKQKYVLLHSIFLHFLLITTCNTLCIPYLPWCTHTYHYAFPCAQNAPCMHPYMDLTSAPYVLQKSFILPLCAIMFLLCAPLQLSIRLVLTTCNQAAVVNKVC